MPFAVRSATVLAIVAEKTGYPPEMLDLDLDMEADLGVDTVKQAETFAAIRTAFDIPRADDLKLRDYPTLDSVIQFVYTNRPDLVESMVSRLSPVAAAVLLSPAPASAPAAAAGLSFFVPTKEMVRRSMTGLSPSRTSVCVVPMVPPSGRCTVTE